MRGKNEEAGCRNKSRNTTIEDVEGEGEKADHCTGISLVFLRSCTSFDEFEGAGVPT